MFDRTLRRMRELIRTGRYVMTIHAVEEMEADALTLFDVERCVLTGEIVEKQKDRETNEWKYLVEGETLTDDKAVVVAKIAPTGKLAILTVYAL